MSKMALFCENSLQFTVVKNFDKKLHFQICYAVLNLPSVFFRFKFIIDLFFVLTFLDINGTPTLHTNVCLTTGIPQQGLLCRLDVLVNFEQIFALFLGTFIADFEFYLLIMNATFRNICL